MKNLFVRTIGVLTLTIAVGYAGDINVNKLIITCNKGDAKVCCTLGNIYHFGGRVPKDDRKASLFYDKACNAGNADACFSLGVQYYNGNGVKKDQNKADQLYKKACDGGISEACTAVSFGR
jgi:hypothetical protein